MHVGFALELSGIDLWNIDLLDTYLDLLGTDIPSKYFVCLHSVFKTPSRYVFKISSRRLQRNNFSSSKTASRRLARGLGRHNIKLLRWRRVEDVFKTCLEEVFKASSRPTDVCWDVTKRVHLLHSGMIIEISKCSENRNR